MFYVIYSILKNDISEGVRKVVIECIDLVL